MPSERKPLVLVADDDVAILKLMETIAEALQQARGNVREAAARLGLGLATVYRKIKTYGIVLPGRESSACPPDPSS